MGKLQQRLVTAGYRGHEALRRVLRHPARRRASPSSSCSSSADRSRSPNLRAGARRLRPRLPAAGHGARRGWPRSGSTGSAWACPTRSTCSWSASKPASASTRRSSASATSSTFAHPDLSDELRLINLELRAGKARVRSAAATSADRTGVDDIVVARRDAGADRQVRHERGAVAARALGDAAHQAAAARGRSGGQDRREDGVPAGVLHLPGDLGRDDRPGRDQVHPGPGADGERNDAMRPHRRSTLRRRAGAAGAATLEETGLGADQIEQLLDQDAVHAARRPASTIADRMRLPYSHPRAAHRARCAPSGWSRCAGASGIRHAPAIATR